MKQFNVAILGSGTVGGGVAKILLEMQDELSNRSDCRINLKKIVELNPEAASKKFDIPIDRFCGDGSTLSKEEAGNYINEIIHSNDIDLVVETIGGKNDFIYNTAVGICNSKKHLVTANKALLAERGSGIFQTAKDNGVIIGYEASVCGAIPIIKTIKESFTGDEIISISGIMNGTSNYILTMMQDENLDFEEALRLAQENGYAEADPTLDLNGYDAGHKLLILIKLAFGIDLTMDQLSIKGIENITKEDLDFAKEMESRVKLICFAEKIDQNIYATVSPMMVKNNNFLADVNGSTNAVRVVNKYSGTHILVGKGAGSLETASSIVADIVFIARYQDQMKNNYSEDKKLKFTDAKHFAFPYNITFETEDMPGITGLVTTAIGNQKINIDTVGHNRHNKDKAIFSIAMMPCTLKQIENAVAEIIKMRPGVLLSDPKIIPILH